MQITSSSGCGEKISTFQGRVPKGLSLTAFMRWSTTKELMGSACRWCSSSSWQSPFFSQSSSVSLKTLLPRRWLSQTTAFTCWMVSEKWKMWWVSLMLQGELKRVRREEAAASAQKVQWGCCCRIEAGSLREGGSSTAWCSTLLLPSPRARMMTLRASMMVARPMVMALRGTWLKSKKSEAASALVILSRQMRRVRLEGWLNGSLKPIWPVLPMPSNCRSSPPACWIRASQRWQWAGTSWKGVSPRGMCTWAGGMSTREKRWCYMNQQQDLLLSLLIGQYSSRLKATTLEKESSPLRCMATR